jgi:hypothetical protein
MKLGRLKHIIVAKLQTPFVIASVAKQSSVVWRCPRLLRYARNDDCTGGVL